MKKSIIISAVIVLSAVAWAGATYYLGGDARSQYFAALEKNGHWGPVSLSSQGYQRGFFASTAKTALKISLPEQNQADDSSAPKTLELIFAQTFRHGPFPFGLDSPVSDLNGPALALVETRLDSVLVDGQPVDDVWKNIPELADSAVLTKIAFDGTISSQLRIPNFERQTEKGKLKWEGLSSDSEYDPNKKTVSGTFDIPGFGFASGTDEGSLTAKGINGKFDLVETLENLYVGTEELRFGSFEITIPNKKTGAPEKVRIEDVKVSFAAAYDNNLVNYKEIMTLGAVTADGRTFGPGTVDIELKNLDAQALSELQTQVQELYRHTDTFDPETQASRLGQLYLAFFMKLIEGTPELDINGLHFVTPMGEIDGSGQIKFAGEPGLTLNNPTVLLQRLEVDADLAVHEALVRMLLLGDLKKKLITARDAGSNADYSDAQIDEMAEQQLAAQIEAILAQKYVVRDGGKLKANAVFKNGELIINGQSLPLF